MRTEKVLASTLREMDVFHFPSTWLVNQDKFHQPTPLAGTVIRKWIEATEQGYRINLKTEAGTVVLPFGSVVDRELPEQPTLHEKPQKHRGIAKTYGGVSID